MRTIYTVAGFFVFVSQVAFAQNGARYLNGAGFQAIKPVQMIGVTKTADDVERERQVGRVVEPGNRTLVYCYERELNNGPLRDVQVVFYFTVGVDGNFNSVTADLIGPSAMVSNSERLVSCSLKMFESFRAPVWSAARTFRLFASFSQAQ